MARKRQRVTPNRFRRRIRRRKRHRGGRSGLATKQWVSTRFGEPSIHSDLVTSIASGSNTFYTRVVGFGIDRGDNVGNRQGNSIFYKGFQTMMRWHNTSTHRLYLRLALVRSKKPATNTNDNLFVPDSGTDWNPQNWAMNSMKLQYLPMNRQKVDVLWQKHIILGAVDDPIYPSTRIIKHYQTIKKKINFNTEANINERIIPRYILCFWFCTENEQPLLSTAPDPVYHEAVYRDFFNA